VHEAVSEVDVTLLVLDAHELLSLKDELGALSQAFRNEGVRLPQVIALNKIDLVEKRALLPLLEGLYREFSDALGESVQLLPLSARSGDGIEELQKTLVNLLPDGPRLYPEDFVTDRGAQFLASEIVREKVFYHLGQEVPYSIAVQVERWEETEELLKIGAIILVERTSQRGIVIGKGGSRLKEIGTAARLELERIHQKRVFLELFVRVEENWTRSERGMRRAGYEW
jgi:GTP-binding protein Era